MDGFSNSNMTREPKNQSEAFSKAVSKLEHLRRFNGAPATFWSGLIESMALLCGAQIGVLLRKTAGENSEWRRMLVWPEASSDPKAHLFANALQELGNTAVAQGHCILFLDGSPNSVAADCAIAVRFDSETAGEGWVGAFFIRGCSAPQASAMTSLLRLAQDTPALYRLQRASRESQAALSNFSSVLDLMAMLNAQHRYMAVAMTFCNELASRHKCDRVSLGWFEGEGIRLQAISHTERFQRKMDAVRMLEVAMEECCDQDEFVGWPAAENSLKITRDHEKYAAQHGIQQLCSVPLRLNGRCAGVVTCERNSEAFTDEEQRLLTLSAEMAVRRLSELKQNDRWFGARLASATREKLGRVMGVEHTWAKVIAILVAAGLAVLLFGRMNYRVEAPFIVRTENVAILSAPFEGYIEEVPGRIGDSVDGHSVLLKLDRREWLLQEAAAAADLDRYTREAEKARAAGQLAEMRIAEAQAEQSRVRLGLVRHRLNQSSIMAPFNGVVVEGDLKKRIGAPVKQGDVLFKVARTDQMYVECNVDERDIHELREAATGEAAFASQPRLKFPIQLQRIEPVAQSKDQENTYVARCALTGPTESWWRPGMSGVAKINVGKRTFFWILTHRTVDFLRMWFWV